MAINDADIRFKATLDDEVSGKAEKLENRLKRLGYTKHEIKMHMKMQDDASEKVGRLKRLLGSMPSVHNIHFRAHTDQAAREYDKFKKKTESEPIKLTFIDNLKEVSDKMFSLRSRSQLPGVPGSNMLVGLGAGAGVTGGIGAIGGLIQQGIQVNSSMEQSLITLNQTLKDSGKANAEMGKIVQIAQQTPFQYKDVLAADVRLRSYNIPTMQGEGGPGNQGWLKSAGDMAAAMNTPITQAVEAIADARQGYFVRMMSYGIRMMREDFQAGGKFAGMTYEQGLGQAIRRFEGAQEAQSKSFQGIVSNLKDVLEQQVIKPIGAPAFMAMRAGAETLQNKLLDPEFQVELGEKIEKVQHFFVEMFDVIQRGKQYFTENLQEPLLHIADLVQQIARVFIKTFGGVFGEVLKTLSSLLYGIGKPLIEFVGQHPKLVQIYAVYKALSILGFSGPTKGLRDMGDAITSFNIFGLIKGFREFTSGSIKLGIALLAKGFIDAHAASAKLKDSLKDRGMADSFREINAELSKMAGGMDQTGTKMKQLGADAVRGLAEGAQPTTAAYQARMAAALDRDYGIDANTANRLITESGKYGIKPSDPNYGINSRKEVDDAAVALRALKKTVDALDMSMSDAVRIMKQFKPEADKMGIGGLRGAPYLTALSGAVHTKGFLQPEQLQKGIYTPDELMRQMMQLSTNPPVAALKQLGTNPARAFNLNDRTLMGALSAMGPERPLQQGEKETEDRRIRRQLRQITDIDERYAANVTSARENARAINRVTDRAGSGRLDIPDTVRESRGLLPDMQGIMGAKSPQERFNRISAGRIQVEENLEKQNDLIDKYNENINELNKTVNSFTVAQQAQSMAMQAFQHDALLPLQQKIEDMQLSMQQYAFNAMRPLEREMARLGQRSSEMGNQMANAQYEMSKWTQGLLDGEQAVLTQLHSMERYNRQLQIMQLTYAQIGADLGTTLYDQGARVRVNPLANFSLQMQQERLQRRQQLAQLRYEDTYGEQHYQIDQAARGENERTERSFADRMAGVKKNVPVIDELTKAQHNLQNMQHSLQSRMFRVNEVIQDQQDSMTRLQLKVTDKQLHGGLREMQEAQYQLGRQTDFANIHLNTQNILLESAKDKINDLRDAGFILESWSGDVIDKAKGPVAAIEQMITVAQGAKLIDDKQAKIITDWVKKADNAVGGVKGKVEAKEDWIDTIKQGVRGAFTGDLWRRFADVLGGTPLGKVPGFGAGAGALSGTATAVSVLAGGAIATGLAGFFGRQGIRGALNLGARTLPRIPGVRRLPGIGRIPGAAAWASGRWAGGMDEFKEIFNLSKRLRQLVGTGIGSMIGGVFGPVGSLGGGFAGGRMAGNATWRQLGSALRHPIQTARQATTREARSARREARAAEQQERAAKGQRAAALKQSKTVAKHGDVVDKHGNVIKRADRSSVRHMKSFGSRIKSFGSRVKSFGTGTKRFSRGARAISAAAVIYSAFSGTLEKVADVFSRAARTFGRWVSRLPGVARSAAGAAGRAAGAAGRAIRGVARRAPGFLRGAGRVLEHGSRALGAGVSAYQALTGDYAAAIRSALYLTPAWPVALAGDLTGYNPTRDDRRIRGTNYGPVAGDQYVDSSGRRRTRRPQRQPRPGRPTPTTSNTAPPGLGDRELYDWYMEHGQEGRARDWKRENKGEDWTRQVRKVADVTEKDLDNHLRKVRDIDDTWKKDSDKRGDDFRRDQFKKEDTGRKTDEKEVDDHQNRKARKYKTGWERIHEITGDYIKKVNRSIKRIDDDLGLTDTKKKDGYAHGGLLKGDPHKVGPGRLIRVNEEGHDEVIIPLAPHRKDRAQSLLKQTQARIAGFAAGGFLKGPDGREIHKFDRALAGRKLGLPGGPIILHSTKPGWASDRGTPQSWRNGKEIFIPKESQYHPHILFHELGHQVDHVGSSGMTIAKRERFKQMIHRAKDGWMDYAGKEGSPEEEFAEAYALGARQGPRPTDKGSYGYNPGRSAQKKIYNFLKGIVGSYQSGGITESHPGQDLAYSAARNIYAAAIRQFAGGGFTGPHGALEGLTPVANLASRKFGLQVSAGRTDHNRLTTGGRVSDHSWGGAIDVSNGSSPTPGMNGMYNFMRTKANQILKQMIYKHNMVGPGGSVGNYSPNDHFNHVHIAIQKAYAEDAERTAKILAAAAKGVDFESLLVSDAGGDGQPALRLGRVPASLRKRGAIGRLYYRALQKKKKRWEASQGGSGSALDVAGYAAGGDAQENLRLGKKMAEDFSGWGHGSMWNALRTLWWNESKWSTTADNPTSDAYGIPQALPGSKMGAGWQTDPRVQIGWGLKYIRDRYRNPVGALNFWNAQSPHWYAAGGKVNTDGQLALLHRGERVLNPAQAAQTNETGSSKSVDILVEIRDAIRKSTSYLQVMKEAAEKKDDRANLQRLNEEVRRRNARRTQTQERKASSDTRKVIAKGGDESGGEDTLALVRTERDTFLKAMRDATKPDTELLKEMGNLRKSAESLVRTAKTPRQKTLARRAVRDTKKAETSARRTVRLTKTKRGRKGAQELAREREIARLAKSGTNRRVLRDITGGKALTGRAARAYEKAAKAAPGSRAQSRNIKVLRDELKKTRSANAKEVAKSRATASRDAKKARDSTSRAAAAQGKKITASGRLTASAARKAGSKTAKAARTSGKHTKDAVEIHGRRQVEEAKKGSKAARDNTKEARGTKKATKESDDKRTRAEVLADRRERKHQKTVEDLLERMIRKDFTVNIHNKAEGAKLSSHVERGRHRAR